MMAGVLQFLREQLRPADKHTQEVIKQAELMISQALNNMQQFPQKDIMDKMKEGADSMANMFQQPNVPVGNTK